VVFYRANLDRRGQYVAE